MPFKMLRGWRWLSVFAVFGAAYIVLAVLPASFSAAIENRLGPLAGRAVRWPAKGSVQLRAWSSQVFKLWGAAGENQALKEELAVTRIEMRRLEEHLRREMRAKRSLNFNGRSYTKIEPAGLLARDPATWFNAFTLDVGSDEDIEVGAGVLNAQGVVGKVTSVRSIYSKAVFVVDPKCRLAARDARSGVDCVVAGDGKGACQLEYLRGQDDVKVGDLIETAAGGLSFPSGVPVGRVIKVEKRENGMVLFALVEPFAQLWSLGPLYVMRKK